MFNCHLMEAKSHFPSPVPGNRRMTRKEKKDLDFKFATCKIHLRKCSALTL